MWGKPTTVAKGKGFSWLDIGRQMEDKGTQYFALNS